MKTKVFGFELELRLLCILIVLLQILQNHLQHKLDIRRDIHIADVVGNPTNERRARI